MSEFEIMVKKQEEIEQLKRDKKELIERLNASQSAIDSATDGLIELYGESVKQTDAFMELAIQLAPNETLLRKLEGKEIYARICDCCSKGMNKGYLAPGADLYCSDECLNKTFSKEEIKDMEIGEEGSEAYYTEWDEIDPEEYYDKEGNRYP